MNKKAAIMLAVTVASVIIVVTAVILVLNVTQQPQFTALTAQDNFAMIEYNGTINFAAGGRYGSAYYENNTDPWNHYWRFIDLYVGNSTFVQTNPTTRMLTISAQNCSVTIMSYDQTENNPVSGQLNYTVTGLGSQSLSLGGAFVNISVYVDGVAKPQNDGWVMNQNTEWITITEAKLNVSIQYIVAVPVPA